MDSDYEPRLDRTAFSVVSTAEHEAESRTYWRDKTPYERLVALEITRRILYGHAATTARLQRVFEIVERK